MAHPAIYTHQYVQVGITIHQGHLIGVEGGIMGAANELKDRLHFAQLYFAFKYLKPGGMVLMRHHMSVRMVDFHFLALMLSLFNPDEHAISNVVDRRSAEEAEQNVSGAVQGAEATTAPAADVPPQPKPPKASNQSKSSWADSDEDQDDDDDNASLIPAHLSAAVAAGSAASGDVRSGDGGRGGGACSSGQGRYLKPTILATKPMAEFAIRKTYWVVYQGFDRGSCEQRDVLGILLEMLRMEKHPYSLNEELEAMPYNNPNLCGRGEPLEKVLAEYGDQAIGVLETVWRMQVVALQGFMDGKKDRMCRYGNTCRQWRRGQCHMAHHPDEMVWECWCALQALPQHDVQW